MRRVPSAHMSALPTVPVTQSSDMIHPDPDLSLSLSPRQAVPKRSEDDSAPAPPLIQENVFIESIRPKYLEDLHSEALEGLKMMQQEGKISQ